MFVSEVNKMLSASFDQEGLDRWWSVPRFQLQGRSAATAWTEGDRVKVYSLAAAVAYGSRAS